MAITVIDIDASGFVHWIIGRLDPSVQALGQGGVPEGAAQALNGRGTVGWTGPCPPAGSGPHHYVFTLYAMSTPSGVTAGIPAKDALAALANVPATKVSLTGTYQRAG